MAFLLFAIGRFFPVVPFYLLSAVPFWGAERVKRRYVLLIITAVVLLRAVVGTLLFAYVSAWELWAEMYDFVDLVLWFTALRVCFNVQAGRLVYSLLTTLMFSMCINTIAFIIVSPFLPEKGALLTGDLVWIAVVMALIAVLFPFAYRLFKGLICQELAALPIKSVRLLWIAPASLYVAALVYIFVLGTFSNAFIAAIITIAGLSFSFIQLLVVHSARKMQMIEMRNELLQENYQTLESHFTQIAQMKHEMNHHLFAIRALFENGDNEQLAKYLSDIQNSFAEVKAPVVCDNRIIQSVLSHASRMARRLDFEISFNISPLPNLSVPDADIVSLFMNLLNNALESCESIQDPSKRWIEVQIKTRKPYLYMSVINARQGAVIMDGERYISTKKDPIAHGHGMDIIQKTAEKHGGFVLFEHTEDTFSAEAAISVV